MSKATLVARDNDLGREVWARPYGDGIELFAEKECECCIGDVETMAEAKRAAREHFDDLRCY